MCYSRHDLRDERAERRSDKLEELFDRESAPEPPEVRPVAAEEREADRELVSSER